MNCGDNMPNELEQFKAILDRAKIVYKVDGTDLTEIIYVFSEIKDNPYYSVWHFNKSHGRLLRVINE
jgi:hypothetical protein